MDVHFELNHCDASSHDILIPLNVGEVIAWLEGGGHVKLLCEASPWPPTFDNKKMGRQFQRRSFAGMSATLPVRVAIFPIAIVTDTHMHQSGKAPVRSEPLEWSHTDRIVATKHRERPTRVTDNDEAAILSRLCIALNISHTTLANEAVLVYSPTPRDLFSALAFAIAQSWDEPMSWHFVSDQPNTVAHIAESGGVVVPPRQCEELGFEYFNLICDPIFGMGATQSPLRPS